MKGATAPDILTLHRHKGATMLSTLQRLGIMQSVSLASLCDDNPCSESLLRTLKYSPPYLNKPFADIEQARHLAHTFVN